MGENGLQDVLGWDLSLLQASPVLGDTGLAGNVSLADSTRDHSEHGIWSLNCQLVGDQLIKPPSGNSIILKRGSLQKFDQILDGSAEVTADAQLLQGYNHVLPRGSSVLTIGENVTELGVGEAVNGGRVRD